MQTKSMTCLDLKVEDTETVEIEIQTRPTGRKVVYVHIDGITVLRIGSVKLLEVQNAAD